MTSPREEKPMCCGCYNDADKCDCNKQKIQETFTSPREVLRHLVYDFTTEELNAGKPFDQALSDLAEIVRKEVADILESYEEHHDNKLPRMILAKYIQEIVTDIVSLFTDKEQTKKGGRCSV